jgi:hypothetical protein
MSSQLEAMSASATPIPGGAPNTKVCRFCKEILDFSDPSMTWKNHRAICTNTRPSMTTSANTRDAPSEPPTGTSTNARDATSGTFTATVTSVQINRRSYSRCSCGIIIIDNSHSAREIATARILHQSQCLFCYPAPSRPRLHRAMMSVGLRCEDCNAVVIDTATSDRAGAWRYHNSLCQQRILRKQALPAPPDDTTPNGSSAAQHIDTASISAPLRSSRQLRCDGCGILVTYSSDCSSTDTWRRHHATCTATPSIAANNTTTP